MKVRYCTINRTKVELKQELKKLKEALFASINRTKVELKLFTGFNED